MIVYEHFNSICRKYPGLQIDSIQSDISETREIPKTSELDAYKMLKKFAKRSPGHGDLPKRLLKEFAPELATPYSKIINCSISSGIFPEEYKKAEITPIPKVNPPRTLSDLRPISKTAIGGKIIETVIMKEHEKDLIGKLDPDQFGNCKGCSTTHALIRITIEAFNSTDKKLHKYQI